MRKLLGLIFVLALGCGGDLKVGGDVANNANNANNGNNANNANNANNQNNANNVVNNANNVLNNANNVSNNANNANNTNNSNSTANNDPMFQNPCESGPLSAPITPCAPAVLPTTGDPQQDCVNRINQFRWECQCLPPLERWTEGEACADQQAAYDAAGNGPHAGFQANVCSPRGNAQNECPGWGDWNRVVSGCLQQMWDEGPGEPFSEHGHYINMSNTQYSRVACGEGDGWFVQNFQ